MSLLRHFKSPTHHGVSSESSLRSIKASIDGLQKKIDAAGKSKTARNERVEEFYREDIKEPYIVVLSGGNYVSGIHWEAPEIYSSAGWKLFNQYFRYARTSDIFSCGSMQGYFLNGRRFKGSKGITQSLAVLLSEAIHHCKENDLPDLSASELIRHFSPKGSPLDISEGAHVRPDHLRIDLYTVADEKGSREFSVGFMGGEILDSLEGSVDSSAEQQIYLRLDRVCEVMSRASSMDLIVYRRQISLEHLENLVNDRILRNTRYSSRLYRLSKIAKLSFIAFTIFSAAGAVWGGLSYLEEQERKAQAAVRNTLSAGEVQRREQEASQKRKADAQLALLKARALPVAQPFFNDTLNIVIGDLAKEITTGKSDDKWLLKTWECFVNKETTNDDIEKSVKVSCEALYQGQVFAEHAVWLKYQAQLESSRGMSSETVRRIGDYSPRFFYQAENKLLSIQFDMELPVADVKGQRYSDAVRLMQGKVMDTNKFFPGIKISGSDAGFLSVPPNHKSELMKKDSQGNLTFPYGSMSWTLISKINTLYNARSFKLPDSFLIKSISGDASNITINGVSYYE